MNQNKFIIEQYNLEKKYHNLLMNQKDNKKRINLYERAYQEFYDFIKKNNAKKKRFGAIKNSYKLYGFIIKNKVGVDYGCGYGSFSNGASKISEKVYGIDASKKVIKEINLNNKRKNIKFECRQSMKLSFKSDSIDYFYSTGLLEHLHPKDALEHLREVCRCLKKGGKYILITPNRFFGPSDVSKFFLKRGSKAKGLHLKEYTYDSLYEILSKIGFKNIKTPIVLEYLLLVLKMPFLFRFILTKSRYKIFLEKKLRKFPKWLAELLRIRGISLIIEK